jgi:signal-transduction protein with cAMP-binding, CBS, and nucleotidyltransferase domain
MSRGVDPVAPSATVQEAATQMAEFDVGAVFVGDESGLLGVLTDRDIILRVVVEGRHPEDTTVAEVMSRKLFSCKEDDSVESVVAEMRERQIRRMPVYDESGKTVAIVTLSDLAKGFEGPEQLHETIRRISEPHRIHEAPEKKDANDADASHDAESEAAGTAAKSG